MAHRRDLGRLLREWEYRPGEVSARLVTAGNGRKVLQMRVDLGILQLETENRPDGTRPEGADTFFDHLLMRYFHEGKDFELSEDEQSEVDREFLQFYHRRLCWLQLREFRRATKDANHTLQLMDFLRDHGGDEEWNLSHEQYRPFVLFHRVQASALAELEDTGAHAAVRELSQGLDEFRALFERYEVPEYFEEDELVRKLMEMRESIREQFDVLPTLQERLSHAVEEEQYELAAKLRDEIQRRGPHAV